MTIAMNAVPSSITTAPTSRPPNCVGVTSPYDDGRRVPDRRGLLEEAFEPAFDDVPASHLSDEGSQPGVTAERRGGASRAFRVQSVALTTADPTTSRLIRKRHTSRAAARPSAPYVPCFASAHGVIT